MAGDGLKGLKEPLLEGRSAQADPTDNGSALQHNGTNGTAHGDYVLLPVDDHEDAHVGRKDADESEPLRPKKEPTPAVPISRLFYFADWLDILLMIVGGIAAVGVGVVMPMFSLIFSDTINVINYGSLEQRHHGVNRNALLFLGLACVSLVLNFLQSTCFGVAAERQVQKMREAFLKAVLRQEIGWFDTSNTGELATRIKGDTLVVQQGIGEKLGLSIQFFSTFVAGFAIGFSKGWQLALVMLSIVPLLAITSGVLFRSIGRYTTKTQSLYAEAGGVAEQAISSIRTVVAFTGEPREAARYLQNLMKAQVVGVQSGTAIARGLGTVLLIIFGSYGLGLWYGASEIVRDRRAHPSCVYQGNCTVDGGTVLTVFWSILFGSMSIGQCGPNLSAVAEAKGAAAKLLEVVLRKPAIDSESNEGKKPARVEGRIEFKNVSFSYPSRPNVQIFSGFNLTVEPGQTVALVGGSGSGKSTVVALLERFYDVEEPGQVLMDGMPIKELNLRFLRSQLGLVSQEPTLFATSIKENIMYGKKGATMDEIINAAKSANAHEFIMGFPDQYDTTVGEMGVQLSGGQRQRIAIARAILKSPPILLLDEATSALDTTSERVVQAALDKLLADKKRTTLVIAHRLSTIRNADVIVVLEKGHVVEKGTHEELMAIQGGKYRALVSLQTLPGAENAPDVTEEALVPPKRLSSRGPGSGSHIFGLQNGGSGSYSMRDNKTELGAGKADEELPKVRSGRLWRMAAPERNWAILACCAALVNGCTFPLYSLLLSTVVSYFYLPDVNELKEKTYFWASMFPILAVVVFTATFAQLYSFTVMGEKLTTRLRDMTFRNVLRQDIAWFDREENSTGALGARLATEVTLIKNITGQNLGRMVQNVVTIAAAFVIAFAFGSWRLTLVLVGVLPVLVGATFFQMKTVRANTDKSQESVAQAGAIAVQAISGARTVAAFDMNAQLLGLYRRALRGPLILGIKNGLVRGAILGFSQFFTMGAYGLIFWYGGGLVIDQKYGGSVTFQKMLRSLLAVTMSSQSLGQNSSFLGDQAAAESAAARIFAIVDRKPEIDSSSEEGKKPEKVEGHIELRDVHFAYPARPHAKIFKGFNLSVEAGTTVALVGTSGSGKSTVVSLLERYYDPSRGSVVLDSHDLKDLNVRWLRQQIGVVSQEPVLFQGTIAENIAYGVPDATMDDIITAAKAANAHDFITTFPDGYQTLVGERGAQLSGGQKQRLAIARCIVKNPSILLLDEATSALDSESERLVQAALDRLISSGRKRTTIVIAHRLSTIKDADRIVVVQSGRVVEQGTHEELMAMEGGQYKLLCSMTQ